MASEVTNMICALKEGTLTLEQVAQKFRERSWPEPNRPEQQSYQELAVRALDDPDPYVPGSFDDVSAAYHRGDLSRAEYRVLAAAATDSINAEVQRGCSDSRASE